MQPYPFRYLILIGALLWLAPLTGCSKTQAEQAPAAPPAVPVFTTTVKEEPIRTWSEFSGRLQAVNYAEIRPEVSGRITEIKFQDGQIVKAGSVLFVIDPRTYETAIAKAQADFKAASTNLTFAKTEFERAQGLIKTQAIAQRIYDERMSANGMALAQMEGAKAQLDRAKLDLDRAYVKAPISGRVSRAEITVGNLVSAGPTAPILTTIVSNEGIYADFEVDEQTYLQSIRANSQGMAQERQIPVELTLQGAVQASYKGTIDSFDNKINPSSGTIRARAKFKNEDGMLIPGMFVSVRMASSVEFNGILIPERAIGTDQNKKFVYVINKDNKVVYREVELGKAVNAQRIVSTGLKAGEKIIVDGLQHVRPDAVVDPKDVSVKEKEAQEAKKAAAAQKPAEEHKG